MAYNYTKTSLNYITWKHGKKIDFYDKRSFSIKNEFFYNYSKTIFFWVKPSYKLSKSIIFGIKKMYKWIYFSLTL